MTTWIAVKDRLPQTHGYYLTADEKGNVHCLFYHKDQYYPFNIAPFDAHYYMPKYWMPAPAAPTEETDNG